jgi:hypothetical protein
MEIPIPKSDKKSQSAASGESKAVPSSTVDLIQEWADASYPKRGMYDRLSSGSVTCKPTEICDDWPGFIDDDDWMIPVPNAIGSSFLTGKTTPIARFESVLAAQGGHVGDFINVYNPGMSELDTDSDMPSLEDPDPDPDMPSLEDPDSDDGALYIGSADAFHETGSAADLVVQIGFPTK